MSLSLTLDLEKSLTESAICLQLSGGREKNYDRFCVFSCLSDIWAEVGGRDRSPNPAVSTQLFLH